MSNSTMKAKVLRKILTAFDPNDEITFGSSTFSRRPLTFYRTKVRGEKLLLIELNEIHDDLSNWNRPEPEHEARITVGDLLMHIDVPDDWDIGFNCTDDAVHLNFHEIKKIVAIDVIQNDTPEWRRVPE
ncbi:hypothetical protein [Maridesulfovibrio bastinii]|uniref:hypothetical protein n=1 Tax=Maridesulfovibrio bastinii TaxID=47157 RepID=UPI0004818669|nr:hypothetical protein [Maridesulfovibrio bastinii]